jgi:trk system potassium uptake protein TrkA
MKIVVVGCGRFGAELAFRLHAKGHQVVVIDQNDASFDNLHPDYAGRTLVGDVLAEDVLRRAGIEAADCLAAVTNSDAVNAVVGHLARTIYGINDVVVRSYSPTWMPMHDAFGFQVVSSTTWGAQRVEQLLTHAFGCGVLSTGHGEVEVYEFHVPEAWDRTPLAELMAGEDCLPVALTRAGRATLPEPGTVLEVGDVLHLSATLVGVESLRRRLERAPTRRS